MNGRSSMKKDEALLPRTALQSYVTDQLIDDLDRLCIIFTKGNRTELVRQCLEIGVKHFENELKTKLILILLNELNRNQGSLIQYFVQDLIHNQ